MMNLCSNSFFFQLSDSQFIENDSIGSIFSRVYALYESHSKYIHYMAEEARVLARITSKIKEFIQYYGFESDPIEMRKRTQEIGGVLARECGRNRTL